MTDLQKLIMTLEESLDISADIALEATWNDDLDMPEECIDEVEEISTQIMASLLILKKFS